MKIVQVILTFLIMYICSYAIEVNVTPYKMNIPKSEWNPIVSKYDTMFEQRIVLGEELRNRQLTIKFPQQKAAYIVEVYERDEAGNINNLLAFMENGRIGNTIKTNNPVSSFYRNAPFNTKTGVISIKVRMSNFSEQYDRFFRGIEILSFKDYYSMEVRDFIILMFIFASIFTIGLSNFLVFVVRNKQHHLLFFALTCFDVSLRIFDQFYSKQLYSLSPLFYLYNSDEISFRIQHFTFYIGVLFYLLFMYTSVKEVLNNKIIILFSFILTVFSFSTFVLTKYELGNIMMFGQIIAMIMALILIAAIFYKSFMLKSRSMIFLNIGNLILFLAVIKDILRVLHIVEDNIELIYPALYITIMIYSLKFAFEFYNLVEENEGLYKKVIEKEKDKFDNMVRLSKAIVHEVRTPLTGIKGFAKIIHLKAEELIKQKAVFVTEGKVTNGRVFLDKIISNMAIIISESDRINGMAQELIEYAGERDITYKFSKENIYSIIGDELEYFEKDFNDNGIELVFNKGIKELLVNVDRKKLGRAFFHILKNCIENSKNDGYDSIKIVVEESGEKIVVKVIDKGVGIGAENLKRVFEPLFTTKTQGTGLGLTISKGIIERQNGTINISSELSKGTEVELAFDKV